MFIYHMAALSNIISILNTGKILSKNAVNKNSVVYEDISLKGVQDHREIQTIKINGNSYPLHDFIPFYFTPRSVMQYLKKCSDTEFLDQIGFIVCDVDIIHKNNYVISYTDANAASAYKQYFSDISMISQNINLDIINARYWTNFNTDDDPEKGKRERQAEFLIKDALKVEHISFINVRNDLMKTELEKEQKIDSGVEIKINETISVFDNNPIILQNVALPYYM